jgi:hypothetical protein
MVTNTQPHHTGRLHATTRPTGIALTAMAFSFLFGPASVTECFLLDANLPTVANTGSCQVVARVGGRLRGDPWSKRLCLQWESLLLRVRWG